MALPLTPGLTPPELAFLCEMELVTVLPRQRMDSLPLLSVNLSLFGPFLSLNLRCSQANYHLLLFRVLPKVFKPTAPRPSPCILPSSYIPSAALSSSLHLGSPHHHSKPSSHRSSRTPTSSPRTPRSPQTRLQKQSQNITTVATSSRRLHSCRLVPRTSGERDASLTIGWKLQSCCWLERQIVL